METARPAREGDMAACAELVTRALAYVRSMRGGPALVGDVTCEALLSRWTDEAQGPATVYVGEFDGVVVGVAAATIAKRSYAATASGRIECCYVEDGARGVGVGSALMESLVTWCQERGCDDIDALALPGDRLTKGRLEATGFTARLLVLSRRLG
jgi:GNAT superfamily N-acetyltransferase